MGFIQKKNDDGGGAGGGSGLELDLDLTACETCRRELLPWQDTCPDDGGRAVPKTGLPPRDDPHATHLATLLNEDPDTAEQPTDPTPHWPTTPESD